MVAGRIAAGSPRRSSHRNSLGDRRRRRSVVSQATTMLQTNEEFVMGSYKPKPKPHDPKDDPNQDQDQKQSNLQGQAQGQAQAQARLAVQSLDSKSDNKNDNDNRNNDNSNDSKNDNDNKNTNVNENKLDNKLANNVDDKIDNKVNGDVNVDVDLDLKADGLSSPVIDLSHMFQNYGDAIVPQVVTQTLNGGGNQFDIQQVNNVVDNDWLSDPNVTYSGAGGDFKMDAKAEGGDVKMDTKIGDIAGDTASGIRAHADAAITQDAFTQNITQGANIQFNSITMNVAGHDLQDSHDLG
jgi:hypothetical protein